MLEGKLTLMKLKRYSHRYQASRRRAMKIDRAKVAQVFPEKIKVGDEECPDLAAMALNIAIARIKKNSKGGADDAEVSEKTRV